MYIYSDNILHTKLLISVGLQLYTITKLHRNGIMIRQSLIEVASSILFIISGSLPFQLDSACSEGGKRALGVKDTCPAPARRRDTF